MAIKNKKEFYITLDKIGGAPSKSALKEACALVEGRAKINCPAHLGKLRESITSEVSDNEGRVGTNFEYAPYVHQGTGIYAVNGDGRKTGWAWYDSSGDYRKSEKFKDEDNGAPGWVWTRGQQPQPFLQDALDQSRPEIADIFKNAIKEAAK